MTDRSETGTLRVAVDVGGTTMKGALFEADGRVLRRRAIGSFDVQGDALATLVALVGDLMPDGAPGAAAAAGGAVASGAEGTVGDASVDDAGDASRSQVRIGIGTPGIVDIETGDIAFAANLGWRDLALGRELRDRFGVPVVVDHDARAAGRAELVAQRARRGDLADLVFVPIGTGIAAAVVAGGRVVTGVSGAAGEIGHMVAVPGGALCACGQRGCVEAYSSASGLARRYRVNGGSVDLTSAEIVARVGADPIAQRTWDEAVDALGAALASVVAVLDPALIVLGGGLAGAGELLTDPLPAAVGRRLLWRPVPPIVTTDIGSSAGLIGAALLVTPVDEQAAFVAGARRSLS